MFACFANLKKGLDVRARDFGSLADWLQRAEPNKLKGGWCSGVSSASHAEGLGFKSQCVHLLAVSPPRVRHEGYSRSRTQHNRREETEGAAHKAKRHIRDSNTSAVAGQRRCCGWQGRRELEEAHVCEKDNFQ